MKRSCERLTRDGLTVTGPSMDWLVRVSSSDSTLPVYRVAARLRKADRFCGVDPDGVRRLPGVIFLFSTDLEAEPL